MKEGLLVFYNINILRIQANYNVYQNKTILKVNINLENYNY